MAFHPLYHLDLCSGSGMLGLALKIALGGNLRTISYVEREAYAAAALVARMEEKTLDSAPVWDDLKTTTNPDFLGYIRRFHPLVISGGYPCQPFSCAGKRAGANDNRHLWPWIDKLIGQVLPDVCFFENVPGHVSLGYAQVKRDLENRGYRVQAGIFSAEEVGASHRRERLYILALRDPLGHTESGQCGQTWSASDGCGGPPPVDRASGSMAHSQELGIGESDNPSCALPRKLSRENFGGIGNDLADPNGNGTRERRELGEAPELGECGAAATRSCCGKLANSTSAGSFSIPHPGVCCGKKGSRSRNEQSERFCLPLFCPAPGDLEQWESILREMPHLAPAVEPELCRTPNGVAYCLDADRLRLIGNGVVPLAAAYAFISLYAALQV